MGLFLVSMKISRFFRRKEKKIEIRKMNFSGLGVWVDKEIVRSKKSEEMILAELGKKVSDFVLDVKEKIIVLKGFNLEDKKEDERIKNAVGKSRLLYIESLNILIRDLGKIDESRVKDFVDEVNGILLDFNKKSFKNYGRANFLIGDELANIKKSLQVFSGDVLKVFKENEEAVDLFNFILGIKERLDEVISFDNILVDVGRVKVDLDEMIDKKRRRKLNFLRKLKGSNLVLRI